MPQLSDGARQNILRRRAALSGGRGGGNDAEPSPPRKENIGSGRRRPPSRGRMPPRAGAPKRESLDLSLDESATSLSPHGNKPKQTLLQRRSLDPLSPITWQNSDSPLSAIGKTYAKKRVSKKKKTKAPVGSKPSTTAIGSRPQRDSGAASAKPVDREAKPTMTGRLSSIRKMHRPIRASESLDPSTANSSSILANLVAAEAEETQVAEERPQARGSPWLRRQQQKQKHQQKQRKQQQHQGEHQCEKQVYEASTEVNAHSRGGSSRLLPPMAASTPPKTTPVKSTPPKPNPAKSGGANEKVFATPPRHPPYRHPRHRMSDPMPSSSASASVEAKTQKPAKMAMSSSTLANLSPAMQKLVSKYGPTSEEDEPAPPGGRCDRNSQAPASYRLWTLSASASLQGLSPAAPNIQEKAPNGKAITADPARTTSRNDRAKAMASRRFRSLSPSTASTVSSQSTTSWGRRPVVPNREKQTTIGNGVMTSDATQSASRKAEALASRRLQRHSASATSRTSASLNNEEMKNNRKEAAGEDATQPALRKSISASPLPPAGGRRAYAVQLALRRRALSASPASERIGVGGGASADKGKQETLAAGSSLPRPNGPASATASTTMRGKAFEIHRRRVRSSSLPRSTAPSDSKKGHDALQEEMRMLSSINLNKGRRDIEQTPPEGQQHDSGRATGRFNKKWLVDRARGREASRNACEPKVKAQSDKNRARSFSLPRDPYADRYPTLQPSASNESNRSVGLYSVPSGIESVSSKSIYSVPSGIHCSASLESVPSGLSGGVGVSQSCSFTKPSNDESSAGGYSSIQMKRKRAREVLARRSQGM
ncbi:hypothetical protein ACHAWF_010464 [Thalassiosira exigua]